MYKLIIIILIKNNDYLHFFQQQLNGLSMNSYVIWLEIKA